MSGPDDQEAFDFFRALLVALPISLAIWAITVYLIRSFQ